MEDHGSGVKNQRTPRNQGRENLNTVPALDKEPIISPRNWEHTFVGQCYRQALQILPQRPARATGQATVSRNRHHVGLVS